MTRLSFGEVKFGRFKILKNSARNCALSASWIGMFLNKEKSISTSPGPITELRPALSKLSADVLVPKTLQLNVSHWHSGDSTGLVQPGPADLIWILIRVRRALSQRDRPNEDCKRGAGRDVKMPPASQLPTIALTGDAKEHGRRDVPLVMHGHIVALVLVERDHACMLCKTRAGRRLEFRKGSEATEPPPVSIFLE